MVIQPKAPVEKELDLRGLKCPLTFVHLRLALEEMKPGELLSILVDDRLASVDIPRNAELEGHEVISAKQISAKLWEISMRIGCPSTSS
jgi:TusA-related sulfurtransferase